MTCPAENTWLRYLGGALEPVSVDALEQHLDGCAECRLLYANIAQGTDPTIMPSVGTDPTIRSQASRTDPTLPAKRIRVDEVMYPTELTRGVVVDRYLILGTLGRGGMGIVYKAFDPELDRPIALKLVAVNGLGSDADESRGRLLREAKTLAQLSHPNVVAVHDVGAHNNDVFVAMEFVAGTTLRSWLSDKPRTPREILSVFRAAGAGLAAAHRVGIVHRDFKPENVMVGVDGRVRVLDFGLARAEGAARARPSLPAIANPVPIDSELTRQGTIMGTPAYMAPEQDLGKPVDGRSDQFSFCASLFEALFKRRAFAGVSYAEIAGRRLAGDITPVPSVRGVTARVRRALLKGLCVEPAERYPSMDALLVELGGPRRRTKLAIAALALTSIAAGGWATWVALHEAPSAHELCAASAAEVDRVWNPRRRDDLIASVDALKLPNGHANALRVVDAADRYAAEWRAHRTKVCKLMVGGDGPRDGDDLTSARMECLKKRLTNLDATMTLFIKAPSAAIVERADSIVADVMNPIADCDNADSPYAITEATRDRWTPMMKDILAGHTALTNARYDEAEQTAREIVTRARANHDLEPLGAGLLLLGQALSRKGDALGARKALLEAARINSEVRDEELALDAWLELIGLVFFDRDMLVELDSWVVGAEVAAMSVEKTDPRHTQLAFKVGSARLLAGEIDAALQQLERALAVFEQEPDKRKYDIAGVENSLGVAHMYRAEWDAARASLERARSTWASMPMLHPNLGSTYVWLGELEVLRNDFAAAEPHYKRAVETFEALGDSQLGKAQLALGFLYARTGRCNAARALFTKARSHATELHGKQSVLIPLIELGEGTCDLAAGRLATAITRLERASQVKTPASLLQTAHTDFALARALVVQDKARAVELATRAREGFGRFAGARADRDVVDAWLAARRPGLTGPSVPASARDR